MKMNYQEKRMFKIVLWAWLVVAGLYMWNSFAVPLTTAETETKLRN